MQQFIIAVISFLMMIATFLGGLFGFGKPKDPVDPVVPGEPTSSVISVEPTSGQDGEMEHIS